jgi:lipopolysaccharide transport system permease protein
LWAFILPVANTVTWIFLSASGIVQLQETAIPYPVYVFAGTMLWALLMESITTPIAQTQAARAMLTKLNFPREALIISGLYKILFNGGIKIVLLLCAIPFFGVFPDWNTLMLFPIGLLALILAGTAIGLLLTPIGMLYTDIGRVIPLIMQFAMYISPVVFPMPESGWAAKLFLLNPFTPLILNARSWLTGGSTEMLAYWLGVSAVSLVVLGFALILYRITMPILVERMGG